MDFYNSSAFVDTRSNHDFSKLWAEWLLSRFASENNAQIARRFRVSERQVQNWLNWTSSPSGLVVGWAAVRYGFGVPEAA